MKTFVFVVSWIVLLFAGIWIQEWSLFLVTWSIIVLGYTLLTQGYQSAFKVLLNICLALTLTTSLVILHIFMRITFPAVNPIFYTLGYIGTFYLIFDKTSLK